VIGKQRRGPHIRECGHAEDNDEEAFAR